MTTGISDEHRHWSLGVSADSFAPTNTPDLTLDGLVTGVVDVLQEWGELQGKTAAKVDINTLWRNFDAHPLTLLALIVDKYGTEALEWHPDVLKLTLDRDSVALANSAWTKILAVRVLCLATSPWKRWTTFHWIARGLAGASPNFTYLEQPELWHLGLAVDCMRALDPKRPFSGDVDKYVASAFASEGIRYAPPPLQFAQRELDDRRIKCMTCGATSRDDNDTKCVTCGGSKIEKQTNEFAGLRDSTRAWFEKHKNDTLDSLHPAEDDPAGQCGARLVLEHSQILERRRALSTQLRAMGKQ